MVVDCVLRTTGRRDHLLPDVLPGACDREESGMRGRERQATPNDQLITDHLLHFFAHQPAHGSVPSRENTKCCTQ